VSLLEQQNTLARLLTDPGFRDQFLSEPDLAGRDLGLNESEVKELLEIAGRELGVFAESLVRKRLREVEKLLPITKRLAGDRFRKAFTEYAPTFNSQAIKRHFEDAVKFSTFIEEWDLSEQVRDAARFERTRLTFFNEGRVFGHCRSRYDLEKLSGPSHEASRRRRTMIAVWLRVGKRIFHFVI
jgi:hypothetical protein